MRRGWVVSLLTLSLAAPLWATPRHEYVPPEFLARHDPARPSATLTPGRPGELPQAIVQGDQQTPAPGDPAPPQAAQAGASLARPEHVTADRRTTSDQPLKYHAVFDPSVAPFRRDAAYDAVDEQGRLKVRDRHLEAVPIGPPTPRPGRALFYGDLVLETTDALTPLPSVAPDMGILAVQVSALKGQAPAVSFFVDGARNYSVRFEGAPSTTRLRLLVDADLGYFGGPFPANTPLAASPSTLPPALATQAAALLAQLKVSPDDPMDAGVARLTAHFRAFRAGALAAPTAELLADLTLGGVGVCRHRAYAFTVLALAAGRPTRFVQNEAHAFVEVALPDGRYRRIDLGGEAPSLSLTGGQRLFEGPADTLPKPPAYQGQYSAQVGAPSGASPTEKDPARAGLGDGGGDGDGGGRGGAHAGGVAGVIERVRQAAVPLPSLAPTQAGAAALVPVTVRLDAAGELTFFRGEPLPISLTGQVIAEEGGAEGVLVQVFLIPERGPSLAVGPAVKTDAQGRFAVQGRLPPSAPLGRHRLVAASKATARLAAGRSDSPSP